jgi:small subunit ribosomal protein S18
VVPPHRLANENLYPTRYIPPKPPLLGPTNAVARRQDPFYLTGIDPRDQALNPNFVAAFTDGLGRIKSRKVTGLTRKSQNKVAKMVKRARAMGVVGVFNAKNSRVSGYGAEPLGDRF